MYPNKEGFLQSRQNFYHTHEFEDELSCIFNKKFSFQASSDWKLPDLKSWFSVPPWKIKELDTLKSKLNFHKSQLNDFNIEEWSSHTRRRNPAGDVCWQIKVQIDPEFLTQAWTKFYECATTYNIIPQEAINDMKMVSLHLCEAPGAFITSLNHYIRTHYPQMEWDWIANTLNPYYEGNSLSNMINDDRFMFHTLERWHFGVDNTGNLMDWKNSQAIIQSASSLGKVMLVTADGSIDCMLKPDAQEELTSPLHYCEIVTALQTLSPGGTLIYKLFTIFEHSTINLLYFVNNLFGEVNIYKPVTSRQGNSEVYAVCLQYKGNLMLEQYLPTLKSAYGTEVYENMALFPLESIPKTFLRQIEDCAKYYCSIQCQVINNNLHAYLMQKNVSLHRDIKKIRSLVSSEFIYHYDLRALNHECEILKGVLHEENKQNINPRYHRGSYTERQMYSKMSLKEKCQNLKAQLQADHLLNQMLYITSDIQWLDRYESVELSLVFTIGQPLQKVNSSKFIYVPILRLYQQIMVEEEFKEIILTQRIRSISNVNNSSISLTKVLYLPDHNLVSDYHVHEKSCFRMLLNALSELSIGDTLMIENYCSLTHFNVSVLFIISTKGFSRTGFTPSGSIILSELMNKSTIKYLENVEKECERVCSDNMDVLNCVPVQLTNAGDFFSSIVSYNNTFYANKCKESLSIIEQGI